MAESQDGMIGFGSKVEVETAAGSNTFQSVGEVTNLGRPATERGTTETTHMESPNGDREFIGTLRDVGELSVDMNWKPGSTSDQFLQDWDDANEKRKVRITFPNDITWTFSAILTNYSGETPMDDKMTGSITCKVSGSKIVDAAG